jgi:Protein of unknown function (DUF2817)
MMGVVQAFSASYAQARIKFLEAAGTAGLTVQSHVHPELGRDGETLATDVARDGAMDADKLLIVTSACHGAEGYCGSGVQVHALHDMHWPAKARAQGVAVLYVHALNPYGFSHIRRTTHENVDMNRNFHDFSQPLPVNADYRDLHNLLIPAQWPPTPANEAALAQYTQTHGAQAMQAAVSRGQHEYPDGLFFGGTQPTWSNLTVRAILRQHASRAKHLAWIDLHTGLGPSGLGERIFACKDDAAAFKRARAWWSGNGATPVTSIYDGSSTSALLTGLMWLTAYQECPQAQYTGIAMEYGTVPWAEVTMALRAEQWLHNHPAAPKEQARQIKQQLLDAFYTDTDAWKGQIISQARQAMFQAVDGLAESK